MCLVLLIYCAISGQTEYPPEGLGKCMGKFVLPLTFNMLYCETNRVLNPGDAGTVSLSDWLGAT